MRATLVLLAAMASFVFADDTGDDLPQCAKECVTKYTTGNLIANCEPLAVACICKNKEFLNGIACCLDDGCDESGKDAAVKYAQQICGAVKVEVPDKVVCDRSSTATATSSAAPTATTDSAAAGRDHGNILGLAAAVAFLL